MDRIVLTPPTADAPSSHPAESAFAQPTTTVAAHSTSSNPSWTAGILKLVVLAAAFAAGWWVADSRKEHHAREALPPDAHSTVDHSSAATVTVEPVVRRPVHRTVDVLGTLHGFEEVTISARVEGRVLKLNCDVGDTVKPKSQLLEIDSTDHELSVQQAERALQVELSKLGLKEVPDAKLDLTKVPAVVKAKSLLEHAKSRLERMTQLSAKKNVSQEDLDASANDYRTAQAEFDNQMLQAETGLAMIQLKQVDLQIAREQLANTKVLAPRPNVVLPDSSDVTYVVSHRSVSEGTLVRPGTELFRIVISQTLKLRVPVPERYSSDVRMNQDVRIFTSTSAAPFAGTVTRIHPTVDPATRTYQVEIQVPNPKGELKPGSFAKASILTHVDPAATTVPLSALVQFAGIIKIFLVEEGHAKETPVSLGTQTTEWVEIASPSLPEGALVITSGQTAIANQSAVTVRSQEKQVTAKPMTPSRPAGKPGHSEEKSRGDRE